MATNPELDAKLEENQVAAAQQAPVPTVHLELNVNEVNVVFAALQELPHRVADPILRKLMEQATAQLGQPG
jgi:hypothetical protein